MEAALQDGADLVHPDLGTNRNAQWIYDSAEAGTGGDVEEAIAQARADGIVIERRYRQQRLVPAFIEPRSVVVDPTGEQTTVYSATQVPHFVKIMGALTLGIPEHKLRVIAPDVGGGFGGKLQLTPEEVITMLLARKLGRPLKYTESRSESIQSGHHGRDQIQNLTLAATKDGTVTGLKVELLADMGAYLGLVTPGIPDPRRVHVQRDLQVRLVPVRLHQRVHEQDVDRRLPRGRPAGGDVRDRAADGRPRERGRRRPAGDPRAELDHARGVPVQHGRRDDL